MEVTVALVVFLIVAVVAWMRRRPKRATGPLPDVPDAPPTATPSEAPGLEPPYSSVDPYAPPKRRD
jgi:uncharacterized iron-regulated membrane protein